MNIEGHCGLLGRVLGLFIITAALAGCGSSQESGGSAGQAVTTSAAGAASPSVSVSPAASVVADTVGVTTGLASAPPNVSASPAATVVADTVAVSAPSSGSSPVNSSSSDVAPITTTGSVTLSWYAPTENTNDSALTNLAGYVIYYGRSASTMTNTISIDTVGTLTYVISDLSSGTWFFAVKALNASGNESDPSVTVSKTL